MGITHKAKTGAHLSGTEYEASDSHSVGDLDKGSFGVEMTGTMSTGVKGDWQAPCAGTITDWAILADASCTAVFDVWRDTLANFPPTVADTVTASAKPSVSAAVKASSSTLTGWTTSFAKGDVFRFNLDSVSGSATRIMLIVNYTKG